MAKSAAERNREFRARKRAERDAAEAEARNSRNAVAGTVTVDAVEATIAAAKWLTGADAASMAQARTLARRIDLLEHEDETTRALSAHRALSQVLNDLGATATKRLQYELRSRKAVPEEVGGNERTNVEAPANVTTFKRPAKRSRV